MKLYSKSVFIAHWSLTRTEYHFVLLLFVFFRAKLRCAADLHGSDAPPLWRTSVRCCCALLLHGPSECHCCVSLLCVAFVRCCCVQLACTADACRCCLLLKCVVTVCCEVDFRLFVTASCCCCWLLLCAAAARCLCALLRRVFAVHC